LVSQLKTAFVSVNVFDNASFLQVYYFAIAHCLMYAWNTTFCKLKLRPSSVLSCCTTHIIKALKLVKCCFQFHIFSSLTLYAQFCVRRPILQAPWNEGQKKAADSTPEMYYTILSGWKSSTKW